ncbi:MAG: penicillin-binding protein activator [Myxococcota bacterium]
MKEKETPAIQIRRRFMNVSRSERRTALFLVLVLGAVAWHGCAGGKSARGGKTAAWRWHKAGDKSPQPEHPGMDSRFRGNDKLENGNDKEGDQNVLGAPYGPSLRDVQDGKPLVGVVLPLSGPYARYGERVLAAMQAAWGLPADRMRRGPGTFQVGGFTVRVTDSGGDAETARHAVAQLQDDAVVVIGALAPASAAVVAQACQAGEIPLLALTWQEDIAAVGPWVFRMGLTLRRQMETLVRWATGEGMRRFAVLYPRGADGKPSYGERALHAWWDAVERHQGAVTAAEGYDPRETTFTEPVRRLVGLHPVQVHPGYDACRHQAKAARNFAITLRDCVRGLPAMVDFDVLLLVDAPNRIRLIVPSLVAAGVPVSRNGVVQRHQRAGSASPKSKPVQLVGTDLWSRGGVDILQRHLAQQMGSHTLGQLMEGAVFVAPAREGLRPFATRGSEAKANPRSELEVYAADAARLAAWALEQVADRSKEKALREGIREAFVQACEVEGMSGFLTFDEQGNAMQRLQGFAVRDGEIQEQSLEKGAAEHPACHPERCEGPPPSRG